MKNKINTLITTLGEKFGFDAHYFTKNTFWLLVGQGMMSVAAFLIAVVLANFVSKESVGDYRVIVSLYAVVAFITIPGIGTALMHSIVNHKDGAFLDAMRVRKKYGVLAFLAGLLFAAYFGILKHNLIFALTIAVMSACLPVIETYSLYILYLQSKHEFKYSSISSGITRLVSALAIVAAVFLKPSALWIVAALYISQAVITYFQYIYFLKKYPLRNETKDENMLPYAKHITYAGILSLIFSQSDKFILYHFFGPVALAQYWIASTIPQETSRVVWTMSQVVYPKFIQGDHTEMKNWLPGKLIIITLFLLATSALYGLIAYPFFHLFFPQYIDQVAKSIVLMFAFVVAPYNFVWIFFTAQRHVKVTYISSTVDPILQIALYIALIPPFGIWGLVYAMLLKTVLMNIIAWVVLKRY